MCSYPKYTTSSSSCLAHPYRIIFDLQVSQTGNKTILSVLPNNFLCRLSISARIFRRVLGLLCTENTEYCIRGPYFFKNLENLALFLSLVKSYETINILNFKHWKGIFLPIHDVAVKIQDILIDIFPTSSNFLKK